jgi:predicted choloylglycine hydrolase
MPQFRISEHYYEKRYKNKLKTIFYNQYPTINQKLSKLDKDLRQTCKKIGLKRQAGERLFFFDV